MTDREKLINLLNTAISDADITYYKLMLIANYLLDNGVTVRPWIPVTERWPETMQPVIVCRGGGKVEQGYKDVGDWWKVYGTRTKHVTHWMPLPEPPEEE